MNSSTLAQRPQWLMLASFVLGACAIGGALRFFVRSPELVPAPVSETPEEIAVASVTSFESPMTALSDELRNAASPADLVTSTASADRLSVITVGRPDPFAPITQSLGSPKPKASSQPAIAANQGPVSIVDLPTAPVASIPDLPPVPVAGVPSLPTLPAIPMATSPVTIPALPSIPSLSSSTSSGFTPQNPVQALQLTGVVQVGDRVGVIVRESQGQTSRHLFVGDHLANGQIKVKAIDLSAGEPLVILEYQGKEYPRIVG